MSKKKQNLCTSFGEYAKTTGVECVRIDPTRDLEEQGPFDLFFSKMTQYMVKPGDTEAQQRLNNVRSYLEKHSEIVQVDALDNQAKTIDRVSMNRAFVYLEQNKELNIHCPQSFLVPEKCEDYSSVIPKSFPFPAVCKSVVACSVNHSHDMGIIWNVKDLELFKKPAIIQEYINHNATISKIYVLGTESTVVHRKSFPNFPRAVNREPVIFNSQEWKKEYPLELTANYAGKGEVPAIEMITKITHAISEFLGLTLFGYDIITDINTGKYVIIDINYFPGYGGVKNFEHKLLKHLLLMYQKTVVNSQHACCIICGQDLVKDELGKDSHTCGKCIQPCK